MANQKWVRGGEFGSNPNNGFAANQGQDIRKFMAALEAFDDAGFAVFVLAIEEKGGSLYSDCFFVVPTAKTVKMTYVMEAIRIAALLQPSECHSTTLRAKDCPMVGKDSEAIRFWWD